MEMPHEPKQIHSEEGCVHHGSYRKEEKKRLLLCIIITFVTMIAEFAGGYLTNSLALISDAGHMFSHVIALLISYVAIVLAARPINDQKTFGYYRLEILSAFINGIFLIILAFFILYAAIERFNQPETIKDVPMLIVAIIGLIVNIVTALILFKVSHDDINVKGAFLHMIGDTLSSVGVIGAAAVIHFTGWVMVDALVSVVIAFVIAYWAIGLIKDSTHILMESTPKHLKLEEVSQTLKKHIPTILEIHDMHIWEITSHMYAMSAHIKIKDCQVSDSRKVIDACIELLNQKFDINHSTIQIECE